MTIVTKADVSNTTITRDENVSSDVYDPNMSNNKDSSSVTVLPEADLEVIKGVSDASAHKGDAVIGLLLLLIMVLMLLLM
ncbi:MAG: hypothetical protein E7Z81_08095 [Methanobrevibacter sp.]|uniref:hypothetical protein n=1 Tax=Methanobrevibacter sp. TaxID=66852 RepID=UPI0025FBA0AC|nr:hypothetical protein [Methanobrevibacter sp.]MBE6498217.1 hypothetical protein [Methanobrevibacter sp.]